MSDLKGKAEMEELPKQLAEAKQQQARAERQRELAEDRAKEVETAMEGMRREMRGLAEQLDEMRRRLKEAQDALREQEAERERQQRRRFGSKAQQAGLPEVFGEFDESIGESGWEEVYRRWMSREDNAQVRRGRSGASYSVIPGTGGACHETVVVFIDSSRYPGWGRGLSGEYWPYRMHRPIEELEALKLHLVECQRVRRVLILTDMIHGESFRDEVMPWVRAWEDRGVAFALGMVAPDQRRLTPIPIGR